MVLKKLKKLLFIIIIIGGLFMFTGCSQSIAEVKSESNVGKEVTTSGVVTESIKLGDISGYAIKDDNGDSIYVSSTTIPAEGDEVTVSGILRETLIIGYYIEEN